MADNFNPSKKHQTRADERWNELSAGLSKLGPLNDFEIFTPRETSPPYQTMTAPTINPKRPRALKLAYSREASKLVVKFRDGTWWEYNEIEVQFWNDLKASNSTGRYLKHSGLDAHDAMGPFNPDEMAEETRVLFNEL
jgi:hypothetical protein